MAVHEEIQDPEMRKIVEEVEAEEGTSQTDEHKEAPETKEAPEKKETPKEEKPKEDPGKIDNQEKEEGKERVKRFVPVGKLQHVKEEHRLELAAQKEALELTNKQVADLTLELAELKKNGVTKEEKKDELEELANKFDVPLEFLQELEKVSTKRFKPEAKVEEAKPEEKKAELSAEDQVILDQAKQDKGFEDEFKTTAADEDLSAEDQELFKANKAKVKELAFTKKYAKTSLSEIFLKAVKPEVTGSKSSEDGGINGDTYQKRIEDVTDDDLDKMSDEEATEYLDKLAKRKK